MLNNIIFWGCPIIYSLSNRVVGETMNINLINNDKGGVGGRLGYFVWEEFVFQA